METVLFACVHNAGRSQMAAALFGALADPQRARAISAGTKPAERVQPEVVAVLGEVGIELADSTPRLLTESVAATATVLVTMGCGETCPVVPGTRRFDWALADPRGQSIARVRAIRDQIRGMVLQLIDSLGANTDIANTDPATSR